MKGFIDDSENYLSLKFFDLFLDGGLNLPFWAPHLVLVNSILMQLNLDGSPLSVSEREREKRERERRERERERDPLETW